MLESLSHCQVATFFDQNHESNHKNSMIGQSVIIEVDVGDKVQVCFKYHYNLFYCLHLRYIFIQMQNNCFCIIFFHSRSTCSQPRVYMTSQTITKLNLLVYCYDRKIFQRSLKIRLLYPR